MKLLGGRGLMKLAHGTEIQNGQNLVSMICERSLKIVIIIGEMKQNIKQF